jgi:hypothetical protein
VTRRSVTRIGWAFGLRRAPAAACRHRATPRLRSKNIRSGGVPPARVAHRHFVSYLSCFVAPERALGLVVLFDHADAPTNAADGRWVNEILRGPDPGALLLP